VPKAFCWDEIEEWYFKLHFYNFFEDLEECLAHVRRWSEKDREEFLQDMKEHGMMNKVFRIPRGLNEHHTLEAKNKKKADVNDGA
jgi:imidazoleglycerol phosphate dehydratase HisB